jgi:hypothetical protein
MVERACDACDPCYVESINRRTVVQASMDIKFEILFKTITKAKPARSVGSNSRVPIY